MCKGNCASSVKINPPQGWSRGKDKNEKACALIGIKGLSSRAFLPLRFCLTFHMRHNYYYAPERYSHGETQSARAKDRRAETDGHAQSPCGNRDRSPVPTEPLLRPPRPSAGPLRDAATAQRRTDVDPRCGGCFWGLATHVLSGPSVFPTMGTGGPIAGSAGAPGWAQADRRSSGLRGQFAGVGPQAHHRAVRQSCSRTFGHNHPQTQPGASSGSAQKKTATPNLKLSIPGDAAAAYEALRPHLIDPANPMGAVGGRTVLLRQGMLVWASASRQVPASSLSPLADRSLPSEVSRELVHVMAELIIHRKGAHA
jgi:hypothetical protein